MTQSIFKYGLSPQQDVVHRMPQSAQIVACGLDGSGWPCIWALMDVDEPNVERKFGIYGAGGRFHDKLEYRGTYFDLPFVWHVFEDKLA